MGYIEEAQERAKRRKSPWNLLLIPAVVVPLAILWWLSVLGAESLHTGAFPGQSLRDGEGIGIILATSAPFFGALPLAMIVGNALVWLFPPARRALAAEARTVPGTDFKSSNKRLLILALALVPTSLLLTVYGALQTWSQ